MSDSTLRERSKSFAKEIVFLCRDLKSKGVERDLVNQLLRCGTSIGANIHEGQYGQGIADFISKFEIALKECHETEYWLELIFEVGGMEEATFKGIKSECGAIRRMLISSCKTMKERKANISKA